MPCFRHLSLCGEGNTKARSADKEPTENMDSNDVKQLALALAKELAKAPANEPTISELWAQYKASRQLAPLTLRGYGYTYGAQMGPRFGHLKPSELTPVMIEEWRNQRRKEGTKTRGKKTTVGCRNQVL
jgi:hypothetical protein